MKHKLSICAKSDESGTMVQIVCVHPRNPWCSLTYCTMVHGSWSSGVLWLQIGRLVDIKG